MQYLTEVRGEKEDERENIPQPIRSVSFCRSINRAAESKVSLQYITAIGDCLNNQALCVIPVKTCLSRQESKSLKTDWIPAFSQRDAQGSRNDSSIFFAYELASKNTILLHVLKDQPLLLL